LLNDDQQATTLIFTTGFVQLLSESGFSQEQTGIAAIAAMRLLFGVVWMIEPESLDSEDARSFAQGLLKAVIAHQYQK
jgi:hypothetical protein